MSSAATPREGESSTEARASRPRRGTRQSGFSLLARGEPKIWLTGGMLVICLAMIVALLTLIVINGAATFWPGPLHWLILSDNQMDIGEPQTVEYRKRTSAEEQAAAEHSGTVTPSGSIVPKADEEPSRFYRTANFDITGRHYRWFEPDELDRAGIVQPEWAVVIERLSWGRMLALPSRLTQPVRPDSDSDALARMLATDTLMKELAGSLESLADPDAPSETPVTSEPDAVEPDTTEPDAVESDTAEPDADTPDAPVPEGEPSEADAPAADAADGDAAAVQSPLASLSAGLSGEIERARAEQLKQEVARRLQNPTGQLMVQGVQGSDWTRLNNVAQLGTLDSIAAAQVVWDEYEEMLRVIQPLVDELTEQREHIQDLMRQISRLDRRLSDARVSVRQAELDTGRSILTQVDSVGPLVETLVTLEVLEARVKESAATAPQAFSGQPEQAALWQRLLARYQEQVLAPALESARGGLAAWRTEFAGEPPAIQNAATEFEQAWREVLEQKQPLETQIRELQAQSEGYELAVLIPSDPQRLELAEGDWTQLKEGKWTASAVAALSAQGLTPLDDSTVVSQFSPEVTQVTFIDPARGRQALWCIDRSDLLERDPTTAAAGAGSLVFLLTPQRVISCNEIVRIFPANKLGVFGKLRVYGSRWYEFLLDEPREANTEGGVFPAIWGTVVMTLIMTLAVVPFGVIAALYLREYTRSGPIVSLVRISINNLAGVPSIVYGVFGLAFFCYTVGAYIDGGPKNAEIGTLPSSSWYGVLGFTALVGVLAFLFSLLSSGHQHSASRMKRLLMRVAPVLWFLSLVGIGLLLFKSPFFDGFYEARLPTPTFGKEGLIWASLTLALLTLPVVIVATEEALAAVPNSLREGSLACGASKWQTIYRIVLPHARPGILTGAILAMARGIGEVAPLMLVGALPVAPDLPLDTEFPYFHGSRSFMHLGYQIYWLGFQSQNSEASKPLVFTCTLLLLLIVIALNLSAILLRARLRRRFQGNQF